MLSRRFFLPIFFVPFVSFVVPAWSAQAIKDLTVQGNSTISGNITSQNATITGNLTLPEAIRVPTAVGNSGKTITSNGTTWIASTPTAGDSLPSVTGNSGKFLTNNGTAATWATISGGGDVIAANNLSDLSSAATARINLGLGTTDSPGFGSLSLTSSLTLSAGSVRLPNTYGLLGRNAANTAYIPIVTPTAADVLEFGSGGYSSNFKGPVTITHGTTYSLFLGSNAGTTSTGIWTTGVGTDTAAENTGDKVTAIGYRAAMENTGHYVNAVGDGAAQANTGNYAVAIGNDAFMANTGGYSAALGWAAGRYNRGIAAHLLGWNAGRFNLGGYSLGLGASTLQYNDGANNTALGVNAFSLFRPDGAGAKAFDYTAITVISGESTIAIPSHDFGSPGDYVLLKYTQGTSAIGGLANNDIWQWYIVDANTIRTTIAFNITSAGTGTGHTLTPQFWIGNSVAVGAESEPDASNQVMLGNPSTTQVKTVGLYIGTGLSITGQSDLTGPVYVNANSIFLDNTYGLLARNAADSANVPLINLDSTDTILIGNGGYNAISKGNHTVSGILKAGSTPVSLTNAAGNVLSAALETVNSNVGTYGSATASPAITINAKGQITAASNATISIPATAISDSTISGRTLLTAASAVAQKTALSLSASDVGLGSVENTALSTWGGSTNIVTLGNVTTGTWSGNTVTVAKGGTGVATLTANAVLTGNGTGAVTSISPGTSGNVLTSNGTAWTSAAPAGGGNVTGGTLTANAVIVGTSGTGIAALASLGNSGAPLLSAGAGAPPAFGALNLAGGSNIITGTLPVGNGGTGATSYTNGQLLIGNTTSGGLDKATITEGIGINVTNSAGGITIKQKFPDTVEVTSNTTLTTSHLNVWVDGNHATTNITLSLNTGVFAAGDLIFVRQKGAAKVLIGGNATISKPTSRSAETNEQNSHIGIRMIDSSTAVLFGDLK